MKINTIETHNHLEISKELEIINFRVLKENLQYGGKNFGHWILDDRKVGDRSGIRDSQFTTFQKAMRFLFIWGQCVGLNAVCGITNKDPSKMRFTVFSLRFLYTLIMAVMSTIAAILSMYKLSKAPSNISSLAFTVFYTTISLSLIFFIPIATKWPTLMKELSNCRLDDYVQPGIIRKCNYTCLAFITAGFLEHTLSLLAKIGRILDCSTNENPWNDFHNSSSPWYYQFDIIDDQPARILLQFVNITGTVVWNYLNMFIVCISLYLTSILMQINKKVVKAANKNYMPSSVWGSLREDYTRATRLVRLFDDVISPIVLVSFANDLFFVCGQLFNTLSIGVRLERLHIQQCPHYPSGALGGYEYPIYLTYSLVYLCARFVILSLATSGVNSASVEPSAVLYSVPSTAYSKEIERFLNQVNGDFVGLTGLRFFNITREVILSVASTIVTYELVLLQFSNV